MELNQPTHIFVVENNKVFVRMLDYVFSKSIAYRFLDFKTGEDALKNMHLNPEIIVLDYRLPGMNGLETLLEIKEQHPDLPVLMLIGENDGKLPAEFLNAGAADFILKDGNEVAFVIEKLEAFFKRPKINGKRSFIKLPPVKKKVYYALLLIILITAGLYYYQ